LPNSIVNRLPRPDRTLLRVLRQRRIRRMAPEQPCRVVVGASRRVQSGWIGTEIEDLDLLRPETWTRFFGDESIDAILAEHVWEHLTAEEGRLAARTCRRFLKPGGYLRVAVPDGLFPDENYIEHVRPGGSGAGAHDHHVLYDHRTLSELFVDLGFRVSLLEYHDVDGTFRFEEWDPEQGMIRRSRRFDPMNQDGQLRYSSLILDACKPASQSSDSSKSM